MSYASQLKRITGPGEDDPYIHNLTCCNGKVYALYDGEVGSFVIQLDILVKDKEVSIKLLLLGRTPFPCWNHCRRLGYYLKGYCTELYCIIVGFEDEAIEGVYSYKVDMTSVKSEDMERFKGLDMSCKSWQEVEDLTDLLASNKMWEELVDLKDAILYLEVGRDHLIYYTPMIASALGGYIHIRHEMILYSYHVKDNSVSLSYMPSLVLPTSNVSLWECRLKDDNEEIKCTVGSKQKEDQMVIRSVTTDDIRLGESNFLNLPSEISRMIMEHCVGVEYMNFRATCKRCHVESRMIQWSNETSLSRLHTYSLISPWLMVLDQIQGIITFTDPILGYVYFMKNLHLLLYGENILCSRFGWLMFESSEFGCLVMFNPFTNDLRQLPEVDCGILSVYFSAPPTSPDCMVVVLAWSDAWLVLIHYVARDSSWRTLRVGGGGELCSINFPTFYGKDLYALRDEGELVYIENLCEEDYPLTLVDTKSPTSCCRSPAKYYLLKCDQDLLKVIVGKFGEGVEVFKRNDIKQIWEKIDSLGNHMIYICGTTCLYIEAKTREMENKIYFPVLHSENRKIVFYSLETSTYHTFSGENIQQHFKDFFGATYHLSPHVWIEPTWS